MSATRRHVPLKNPLYLILVLFFLSMSAFSADKIHTLPVEVNLYPTTTDNLMLQKTIHRQKCYGVNLSLFD